MRLVTPQTHQARQFFARGQLALSGTCLIERGISIKALLARLREAAPVARLRHAPAQLGPRLGGNANLLHVAKAFFRSERIEIGFSRFRCQRNGIRGNGMLRACEAALLHFRHLRHKDQRHHVEGQRLLDLEIIVVAHAKHGKTRIGQPPCLHQFRLGNAQFLKRCLQAPVVEQCNLNRVFDCQGFREQLTNTPPDRVLCLRRIRANHVLGQMLSRHLFDRAKAAIRTEPGTTR